MPAARCGPLRPPGFGNAGPVAGFLDLTLQGLREQWQEAECQVGPEIRAELSPLDPQVLGPGRITTLATTCEEFDTGSSCSRPAVRAAMCTGVRGERPAGRRRAVVALARRLGEYRDVVSSVFLRYCRGAQSGGERAGRERESTAPSLRPAQLSLSLSLSLSLCLCAVQRGRRADDGGLCFDAQVRVSALRSGSLQGCFIGHL